MIIRVTLPGNAKSTGNLYRTRCAGKFPQTYLVPEGKKIKARYAQEMSLVYRGPVIDVGLEMKVKLYFGDRRKRDVDNFHKLIQDAGTGIIYKDDDQIQKLTIEKFYDKANPRAELIITEYQPM